MLVAKLLSKIFKDDGVILMDYDGQKYICGEPKNKKSDYNKTNEKKFKLEISAQSRSIFPRGLHE